MAAFPAIAELRVITITLEGGQKVTTTVDVPPGTPLEQIQLPEISTPIEGVEEGGPGDSHRRRAEDNGGDDTADKPETDKAREARRGPRGG